MDNIKIYDSKFVLRNSLQINNLIYNEPIVMDCLLLNVKYVRESGMSDRYITTDYALNDDFTIKKEIRRDIFDFYNTQLTNMVNRKLANSYCDVSGNNNNIKQTRIQIDSYEEDWKDLLDFAHNELPELLPVIKRMNIVKGVNEDAIKDIIEEYASDEIRDQGVIPLFYFTRVSAVILKSDMIPKNRYLNKGYTMLIGDTPELKEVLHNNLNSEMVVFADDNNYIIDLSYNNNPTIRKSTLDEYWGYKVIDYS